MSLRRKLVVGNWKMNGSLASGAALARSLAEKAKTGPSLSCDMVLCPPAILLHSVGGYLEGSPVLLGAQDCHTAAQGAYTGEISAAMLKDVGCRYVILGHSERRAYQGENNALIAQKILSAQTAGLVTILCVGESKEQRDNGNAEKFIERQLIESLPEGVQDGLLVVAYEPIWAIGTGEQPDVATLQALHRLIRKTLGERGAKVQILYGGSVTAANAVSILAAEDVDGVLVGGACLNADGFWAIAQACPL